jgi:hypothetical protein
VQAEPLAEAQEVQRIRAEGLNALRAEADRLAGVQEVARVDTDAGAGPAGAG